jgi:aspartate/methionine/tyrosine aminotransferase
MIFTTFGQAQIKNYPFYNENQSGFNLAGLAQILQNSKKDKVVVILNFPNNPTGYSPTKTEAQKISELLIQTAAQGKKVVAIFDDSYFGLFYENNTFPQSIFSLVANSHPNLLAVKLCGVTKENFSWGFRVGFITYGIGGDNDKQALYDALQRKTMGAIRGTVSNINNLAQNLSVTALQSPQYHQNKAQKFQVLKKRALKTKEILDSGQYTKFFTYYPFNSGYFMCIKLKSVKAEALRLYLLDKYGIGTIAVNESDLRIAFSCLAEENLADLFATIAQAYQELAG